jgi:hypothetical protein
MNNLQNVSALFLVVTDVSLAVCNTTNGYVMSQDTDGVDVALGV